MTFDSQLSVDEVIEVRELLEVPAARLAASRRTEETVEAMRTIITRSTSNPPSFEEFEETRGFHQLLLSGSGNKALEIMVRPMLRVLDTRILGGGADPRFWDEVIDDHRNIAQAVEGGDGQAAAESMRVHLEHLRVGVTSLEEWRIGPTRRNGHKPSP